MNTRPIVLRGRAWLREEVAEHAHDCQAEDGAGAAGDGHEEQLRSDAARERRRGNRWWRNGRKGRLLAVARDALQEGALGGCQGSPIGFAARLGLQPGWSVPERGGARARAVLLGWKDVRRGHGKLVD